VRPLTLMITLLALFAKPSLAKPSGALHAEPSRPASFAPLSIEGMSGVWAWRDLSLPAQLLNLLRDYLPPSPRFEQSARQLSGLSLGSWSPMSARAEGLDLRRGLILMRGARGAWRLLVAFRPQRAEVAISELRAGLSLFAPAFTQRMSCAPRAPTGESGGGGWLTCDTPQVREAPPPSWLSAELERGALWAYVPAPALPTDLLPLQRAPRSSELTPLWSSAELHVSLEGDELLASVEMKAPYHPIVSLLNGIENGEDQLSWVHPSSPLDLSLKLTTHELALFEPFKARFPWVPVLMRWVEAGWDGGLLLTFDGGLDHPVLLVGLQEHPWAWDQLTTTLARSVNAQLVREGESDDARLVFGEGEGRWSLPVGRVTSHLLLGLYPTDLKRRTSGLFSASPGAHLKPLTEPGVSGLFIDPGALGPVDRSLDLSLLEPVLNALLAGQFERLVDLPHDGAQVIGLAESLARLSEVRRDPFLRWMSRRSLARHTTLPLLLSLHELLRLTMMVTEGVTVTIRSYLGTLSRLRAELRWRLL